MTIGELITIFTAFGLLQAPLEAQEMPTAQPIGESITVQRVVIDAHVIDDHGAPLANLRPSDLEVQIDSKPATVESIEWIPGDEERSRSVTTFDDEATIDAPHGRLLVFFFQTDFQRARAGGQMRMIQQARLMVDRMQRDDLAAVLSWDSHLKLRQDFTSDRTKLKKAIDDSLKIDDPGVEPADGDVAILENFDLDEARNAATPERGLYVTARALRAISGTKSLLLFGWGLGTYTPVGVMLRRDYDEARRALDESRTTVFTLDISDFDSHSLEVGLQKASQDTGGMYMKTNHFARLAAEMVERAISGRYEIVVKADLHPGHHLIDVKLRGRRGTVLSRRYCVTH